DAGARPGAAAEAGAAGGGGAPPGGGRDGGRRRPAAPVARPLVWIYDNRRPYREAGRRGQVDKEGEAEGRRQALALRPRNQDSHGAQRGAGLYLPEHEPRAPGARARRMDVQRLYTEVRAGRRAAALQGARVQVHTAEEGDHRPPDDRARRKGRRLPGVLPALL